MGINKVQYGNTVLIDLTDTTAVASDVAAGKYFYGKDGVKTLGTGSGGGGSVTQDQDGYIVLPSTGGGGGDITVEALSVTQNGTYTAPTGKAYSPVTVNVSGAQTTTGTFTGGGGISVQIPCSFAPNLIYVYGDLSGDITLRGIVTFSLIKDMDIYVVSDTSSSGVSEAVVYGTHGISGYNDSSNPHATYSNGILTLDNVTNSSSLRFASGVTYNYNLIGW